jgi:hypothetical protein
MEYVNNFSDQLLLSRLLHWVTHIFLILSLLLLLLSIQFLLDLAHFSFELLPSLQSPLLLIDFSLHMRHHRYQCFLKVVELDQVEAGIDWL